MGLTSDTLSGSPRFLTALKMLADRLRGQFDTNPRLSRFLASHQRWLLSQAAFALHLEYEPGGQSGGLTTSALKEMILPVHAASRNTVLNFLDQLMSYRFMRVASEPSRRPRRFAATEISNQAMFSWFQANLASLDHVDGGCRVETLLERPEIFRMAQPRLARHCINDERWREPPPHVAMFLWTESGGMVMDELVCRVDVDALPLDAGANGHAAPDWLDLGRIEARAMAAHFMMSRTHLQRLLRKAVEAGCLRWQDDVRKTHMMISTGYLTEYCRWQSVKFEIIDEAFDWAASLPQVIDLPASEPMMATA